MLAVDNRKKYNESQWGTTNVFKIICFTEERKDLLQLITNTPTVPEKQTSFFCLYFV